MTRYGRLEGVCRDNIEARGTWLRLAPTLLRVEMRYSERQYYHLAPAERDEGSAEFSFRMCARGMSQSQPGSNAGNEGERVDKERLYAQYTGPVRTRALSAAPRNRAPSPIQTVAGRSPHRVKLINLSGVLRNTIIWRPRVTGGELLHIHFGFRTVWLLV